MSEFDQKARSWDLEKRHIERSEAIALELEKILPLGNSIKALEFGAGTGLLSFKLKDRFSKIVLMDNSPEMIKVCEEKIEAFGTKHIKAVLFDLENSEFNESFDVIYNQMVMHHVTNVDEILSKFYKLLNPGGILAITDLYAEDGSFHGNDAKVHKGFDVSELGKKLKEKGFLEINHKQCYILKKETESGIKDFPVFLLWCKKG
jgi:ubiquinone/menaquinone biosynthesis C-methylase UbiE